MSVQAQSTGGKVLAQTETKPGGEFALRVAPLTAYKHSFGTPVPKGHTVRAGQKELWMFYCLRESAG